MTHSHELVRFRSARTAKALWMWTKLFQFPWIWKMIKIIIAKIIVCVCVCVWIYICNAHQICIYLIKNISWHQKLCIQIWQCFGTFALFGHKCILGRAGQIVTCSHHEKQQCMLKTNTISFILYATVYRVISLHDVKCVPKQNLCCRPHKVQQSTCCWQNKKNISWSWPFAPSHHIPHAIQTRELTELLTSQYQTTHRAAYRHSLIRFQTWCKIRLKGNSYI